MHRKEQWPGGLLLFALVFFIAAVIGTFTGKAYSKGGKTTERAKDPVTYWMVLIVEYLGALFLIWGWYATR